MPKWSWGDIVPTLTRSKDHRPTNVDDKADAPTTYSTGNSSSRPRTGLLMLIRDVENGDALGKLTRYEAGLMSAISQTLQHLHLLQAGRNATKVISV